MNPLLKNGKELNYYNSVSSSDGKSNSLLNCITPAVETRSGKSIDMAKNSVLERFGKSYSLARPDYYMQQDASRPIRETRFTSSSSTGKTPYVNVPEMRRGFMTSEESKHGMSYRTITTSN